MKVSNPLTIIAIFSGLAEALATFALVQLPENLQYIFVYFVMAFPSAIVILFFFVLYYKNTVLYAPSDYADQKHYLEVNKIKENINFKIEEIFTKINKKGVVIEKEEIEKAKKSIENSIEETTSKPRKEMILEYLKGNSPSTVKEISENLRIHLSYTATLLNSMYKNGLLIKVQNEKSGITEWGINT